LEAASNIQQFVEETILNNGELKIENGELTAVIARRAITKSA
jgi:hypothetical protein